MNRTGEVMNTNDGKRIAYMTVIEKDGYKLGIAKEGDPGYYKIKEDSDLGGTYRSQEEAQAVADAANERLGITPQDASLIVLSSIGAQMRSDR